MPDQPSRWKTRQSHRSVMYCLALYCTAPYTMHTTDIGVTLLAVTSLTSLNEAKRTNAEEVCQCSVPMRELGILRVVVSNVARSSACALCNTSQRCLTCRHSTFCKMQVATLATSLLAYSHSSTLPADPSGPSIPLHPRHQYRPPPLRPLVATFEAPYIAPGNTSPIHT